MKIIELGIKKASVTFLLFFSIIGAGIFAAYAIQKDSYPDIVIPTLYTIASLDGISPEDADRMLINPMEKQLEKIDGLKEMRSTSFEGGASVIMEFDAGFDPDTAFDDIEKGIKDAEKDLPIGVRTPTIVEINLSDLPILTINLSGPFDARYLDFIAKSIKDAIEKIPSVLSVSVSGEREESIEILIDPATLEFYGFTTEQLLSQLTKFNTLVVAGKLESASGRFAVKLPGLVEAYNELRDLPILAQGDNVVRLSDIATIRRNFKDATSKARFNDAPSISLEVVKRNKANTVATIKTVKQLITEVETQLPKDLKINLTQDASIEINDQLFDLTHSVIFAVILVMIVILFSLGFVPGILVGIAIPGSFLTGILALYLMGNRINMIVFFALVLSIGMLVDAAIVIVEFAARRIKEGASPVQAYTEAASRLALPVTNSQLTTLSAFVPLMFWPGLIGKFMQYLPLTLILVLSASLVMALFFVPIIGAYFSVLMTIIAVVCGLGIGIAVAIALGQTFTNFGISIPALTPVFGVLLGLSCAFLAYRLALRLNERNIAKRHNTQKASSTEIFHLNKIKMSFLTKKYISVLRKAVNFPKTTIALACVALVSSWVSYGFFGKGVEFFPVIEPDTITINIDTYGNLSLNEVEQLVQQVAQKVEQIESTADEIKSIYSKSDVSIGVNSGNRILVELVAWNKRRPIKEIINDIRKAVGNIPAVLTEVVTSNAGPGAEKPIVIEVSSDNFTSLIRDATKVRDLANTIPELINIEHQLPDPGIDWVIRVNNTEASKYNLALAQIGGYVRMATTGFKLSSYRPDDSNDEIDIIARFPAEYRNFDQLSKLRINSPLGALPMSNFVSFNPVPLSTTLRRIDTNPTIRISSDLIAGAQVPSTVNKIRERIAAELNLDEDTEISFSGDQANINDAQSFLSKAFIVALLMIFTILLIQFNSFGACAIILSAIIISTTGVFIGLLVTGQPFGIVMTGIGVIALAGVVVNNNIVLIDTFEHIKKGNSNHIEAILVSGAQRFRPILLTSTATTLSLLPTVLGINIDFSNHATKYWPPTMAMWQQISLAIVSGVIFATFMTLLVTPAALRLLVNSRERSLRRKNKIIQKFAHEATTSAN